MRICKADQHSAQWLQDRLGIPTASAMSQLLTAAKLELSAQRYAYQLLLVGERLRGKPEETTVTAAMDRGIELEDEARDYFSLTQGVRVDQVGLCKPDFLELGASPDGLIGLEELQDGTYAAKAGLEIKCPGLKKHMLTLDAKQMPNEHTPQVQTNLFVTGADVWHFMSYFPELPDFRCDVKPDPRWQDALAEHVPVLLRELDELEARIREEYNC